MAGCDGVCSGVPGSEQPAVCKEVKFHYTVIISCMIMRGLLKLIQWHDEITVIVCT